MMDIYLGGEKIGETKMITSHESIPLRGASTQAVREMFDYRTRLTTSFSTIYINPQTYAVLRALQHERERQTARWPPRRDCRGNIRKRRPDRRRRFRSKEVPWHKTRRY